MLVGWSEDEGRPMPLGTESVRTEALGAATCSCDVAGSAETWPPEDSDLECGRSSGRDAGCDGTRLWRRSTRGGSVEDDGVVGKELVVGLVEWRLLLGLCIE